MKSKITASVGTILAMMLIVVLLRSIGFLLLRTSWSVTDIILLVLVGIIGSIVWVSLYKRFT